MKSFTDKTLGTPMGIVVVNYETTISVGSSSGAHQLSSPHLCADCGRRTLFQEAEEALRRSARTAPSKVQRRGWHQVWKPRAESRWWPQLTLQNKEQASCESRNVKRSESPGVGVGLAGHCHGALSACGTGLWREEEPWGAASPLCEMILPSGWGSLTASQVRLTVPL